MLREPNDIQLFLRYRKHLAFLRQLPGIISREFWLTPLESTEFDFVTQPQ
jgi:hypothetical protein